MNQDPKDTEGPKVDRMKYIGMMITGSLFIIVVSLIFALWVWSKIPEPGSFGDSFGGLTSVFSGLAFWGLIVTILMQMKELELTRDEFIKNRAEFEKSADAQKGTQQSLEAQLDLMKMTANIEALKHLIEAVKSVGEASEIIGHANRIIIELGKKAVYSGDYESILRPNLEIRGLEGHSPGSQRAKENKGKFFQRFELKNKGGELTNLQWKEELPPAISVVGTLPNTLPSGSTFIVEYLADSPIEVVAPVTYNSSFIEKNKYEQPLVFKYANPKIEEPRLIGEGEEEGQFD